MKSENVKWELGRRVYREKVNKILESVKNINDWLAFFSSNSRMGGFLNFEFWVSNHKFLIFLIIFYSPM